MTIFSEIRKVPGVTVRSVGLEFNSNVYHVLDSILPSWLSSKPTVFLDFLAPYFSLSDDDKKKIDVVQALLSNNTTVKAASVSNIVLNAFNPEPPITEWKTAAPLTIDGITISNGDLFLLKNQTDLTQNGIYQYISFDSTDNTVLLTFTALDDFGRNLITVIDGTENALKAFTHISALSPSIVNIDTSEALWNNFLQIVCTDSGGLMVLKHISLFRMPEQFSNLVPIKIGTNTGSAVPSWCSDKIILPSGLVVQ